LPRGEITYIFILILFAATYRLDADLFPKNCYRVELHMRYTVLHEATMPPILFAQPPPALPFLPRSRLRLSPPRRKSSRSPLLACAAQVTRPLATTYDLERGSVALPGRGLSLETLTLPALGAREGAVTAPPVLLVHGSLHGAWAWAPLLARWRETGGLAAGAVAVTLRGRASDPPAPSGTVLDVQDHVHDIVALVDAIGASTVGHDCDSRGGGGRLAPLLVGHSIGGYYCQRAVELLGPGRVAGLILVASTPPSGNGALVWRTVFRLGLPMAWKITMGFIRTNVATDVRVCRDMFFTRTTADAVGTDMTGELQTSQYDNDVEGDDILMTYMEEFRRSSQIKVNMRGLIAMKRDKASPPVDLGERVLVIGGADDVIVDVTALEEAAQFWGARGETVLLPNCPHDLMLASNRDRVADVILDWIRKTEFLDIEHANNGQERLQPTKVEN
jgi:pimeloyl-ACP methyl ester carboxylesterase